jgi:hypothetical protein
MSTKIDVTDFKGDTIRVLYTTRYSNKAFTDGRTSVKTYIALPCGDTYAAWMPVFTIWF